MLRGLSAIFTCMGACGTGIIVDQGQAARPATDILKNASMPPDTQNPLRGIALLMGALVLFVMLDTTAKHLGSRWPVPMLVWARYLTHFLLMLVVLGPSMRSRLVVSSRWRYQIVRALLLLGTTFFAMSALQHMPIAETTAIIFLAPLLVTLLAGPMLGEKVGAKSWAAIAMGFSGVILIARPGSGLVLEGIVLAFGAAVCYAFYQLTTRKLSPTEHPVTMLFYTALVGTVCMSFALPWIWGGPGLTLLDGALLLSLGLYGGTGHFLLIRAFREASASTLAPILYVQLAWATLAGWLVFGHFPDGMALIGIGVIGVAGAMIALDGKRLSRHKV